MSVDPELNVGFWRALAGFGTARLVDILWPEGLPAILLGGGGAFLAVRATAVSTRASLAFTGALLAGALIAVSFASLAILVALPSSRYMRALAETTAGGMRVFLDPFLLAIGLQTGTVLLAFGYSLFAGHVARPIEHARFYVLGFLFVYILLDIGALARALVRHGVLRARDAVYEHEEQQLSDGGEVHALHGHR
jgi:hypothetical protein